MEYALLRSLRALGPGLMLLGYWDLYLIFVLHGKAYFWALDTSKIIFCGYIVGGVYGALTSLIHKEKHAFAGVHEAILRGLDAVVPGVSARGWNVVSPCFYRLVDNDKSLEQKGKGVFFNGLIVTSSFDAIWISLLACVVGGAVALIDSNWAFVCFAVLFQLLAYVIWRITLRRHCDLAQGQVEVIGKRFRQEFRDCIEGCVTSNVPEAGRR